MRLTRPNSAALWAGLTAFVWYAFGAVPLHIGVSQQLGLTTDQTSSWIFIVWASGAISSVALSLFYRVPIPITWTIPGLIYIGTLAGRFTYEEIVAANLIAGILILVLGILGIGSRIMQWLPVPIIMGMFAGSIFGYVTRLVSATVDDAWGAGGVVLGYLLGRMLNNPRIPPVGLAVVVDGIGVAISGATTGGDIEFSAPVVMIPHLSFSFSAVLAVSLPMVVLAMGLGNVQGLGFLIGQGYKVPVNVISTVIGANSIVNALFGGHPAIVARTGVAILASPDAGPLEGRYWANIIASSLTLALAFSAVLVASLLAVLPATFIFAIAGIAILAAFQDALQRAFTGDLKFGALVAFAGAATPFAFFGITSAFWAIVAGLVASLIAERAALIKAWRSQE